MSSKRFFIPIVSLAVLMVLLLAACTSATPTPAPTSPPPPTAAPTVVPTPTAAPAAYVDAKSDYCPTFQPDSHCHLNTGANGHLCAHARA